MHGYHSVIITAATTSVKLFHPYTYLVHKSPLLPNKTSLHNLVDHCGIEITDSIASPPATIFIKMPIYDKKIMCKVLQHNNYEQFLCYPHKYFINKL